MPRAHSASPDVLLLEVLHHLDAANRGQERIFPARFDDSTQAGAAGEVENQQFAGGLRDVMAGIVAGRQHADGIALFKSVNLALQDASTAHVVCQKARKMTAGVGHGR